MNPVVDVNISQLLKDVREDRRQARIQFARDFLTTLLSNQVTQEREFKAAEEALKKTLDKITLIEGGNWGPIPNPPSTGK